MMKVTGTYFLFAVCLLLNGLSGFSQDSEETPSVLWEISRKDLPYKSYLFGTNHLVGSEFVDSSSVLDQILKKTKMIVTEVSDDEFDTLQMKKSMNMPNDEYYSFKNEKDEKILSEYIDELMRSKGFPYVNFKPMAIYTLIQVMLIQKKNGEISKKNFESMDKFFMRYADENSKKIRGLETMEEQISILFDSISIKNQLDILLKFVKNSIRSESKILSVDSCYRSLDIECIERNELYSDHNSEEYQILIENRNLRWVKMIPEIINYEPSVIAVGVGHLFGKTGLISLLRKTGYILTPVYLQ